MYTTRKKPKTVGEMILKSYSPVLNKQQISQFQELGKNHTEIMIENIQKISQSAIEEINNTKERMFTLETIDYKTLYKRPVECDILEELQEINKNHKRLLSSQEDSNVIIYNTKNGSLNRYLGGRCFSYNLSENGKRKKFLDVLLKRGVYMQTKELEIILSCPSAQAVAKIAQSFNDYVGNTLKLADNIKIIKGKNGSGYHINPKICIEKE